MLTFDDCDWLDADWLPLLPPFDWLELELDDDDCEDDDDDSSICLNIKPDAT